jgi:hypothetical protein
MGCARLNSIYRTAKLDEGASVVLDAKQRLITNLEARTDQYFVGRLAPRRTVCPEPSPDVAQAVSTAISASLEAALSKATVSQELAGRFGLASADSIAQLGERIATIQLLRDELSDLCRAFANGAVSATTYSIRLSKLDKKMVTLLISETSAGAFGRQLAAITTTASASTVHAATPEEIQQARDKVERAITELAQKQKTVDDIKKEIAGLGTNPDQNTLVQKQEQLRTAERARDTAVNMLHHAQAELFALLASDARTLTSGMIQANPGMMSTRGTSSLDAATLQRQFLEVDELSTIIDACLTAMDVLRVPENVEEKQRERQLQLLQNELDKIRTQRQGVESEYLRFKNRREMLQRLPPEEQKAQREEIDFLTRKIIDFDADLSGIYSREKTLERQLNDALSESIETLSTLGRSCSSNFPVILEIVRNHVVSIRQRETTEASLRILTQCSPILDGTKSNVDQSLKDFCQQALKLVHEPRQDIRVRVPRE